MSCGSAVSAALTCHGGGPPVVGRTEEPRDGDPARALTSGERFGLTLPASAFGRVGNERSASFRGGRSATFAFIVVAAFAALQAIPVGFGGCAGAGAALPV